MTAKLISLLLGFSISVFAAEPPKRIDDYIREGDYKTALNMIYGGLKKSSPDYSVNMKLASTLQKLGLNHSSIEWYLVSSKSKKPELRNESFLKLFEIAKDSKSQKLMDYVLNETSKQGIKLSVKGLLESQISKLIREKKYKEAVALASTAKQNTKVKYIRALALVELNQVDEAILELKSVLKSLDKSPINDLDKVAIQLALARLYYKKKNWDEALSIYRKVPKDTPLWHGALVEMAWTTFQMGRFRESMSHLSSLHSPYYRQFYIMDTVLLRSFVYHSTCHYREMEKTLNQFYTSYNPMKVNMEKLILETKKYTEIYKILAPIFQGSDSAFFVKADSIPNQLPPAIAQLAYRNLALRESFSESLSIQDEVNKLEKMRLFNKTPLGAHIYSKLKARLLYKSKVAGQLGYNFLLSKKAEIDKQFKQFDFAKYELVAAKKSSLKKSLRGDQKDSTTESQVGSNLRRSHFLSRSVEYYPFEGEYWLDEIGNAHYIGRSNCAN